LSAADRQRLIISRQRLAQNLQEIAAEGDIHLAYLERQRISVPQDMFYFWDQARNRERSLRGAAQEARQTLQSGPNSQNFPELRNEDMQIQQWLQRIDLVADRIRNFYSRYPEVSAQLLQMERAQQDRRSAWENYSRRPKTLIEQILNYTCSGIEEGRENNYWISGANGQNQCIVITDQNSLAVGSRQFDIRSFNERSFRLSIEPMRDYSNVVFGDERNRLTCPIIGNPPLLDRLQRAWGLAFRECPGVKSAF
jgi:hypothetical protein